MLPIDVHIRWMIRCDLKEVLSIEESSFEFPWLEDDFLRYLRERNSNGMVSEHHDEVVGFMVYKLHKTGLEILKFAVNPSFRKRSVGEQMVSKLISKLSVGRRARMTLVIRESNFEGQKFFSGQGFQAVSIIKDFYDETHEDAYEFRYQLKDESEETFVPSNRVSKAKGV